MASHSDGFISSAVQPAVPVSEAIETKDGWTIRRTHESNEVRDPLEDMPEFKDEFEQARRFAAIRTRDSAGNLGHINVYWWEMKRFLRERHGIDWKTPAELNPNTSYD